MEPPYVTEADHPYLARLCEAAKRNGAYSAEAHLYPKKGRKPYQRLEIVVRAERGADKVLMEHLINPELIEDDQTADFLGFRAYKRAQDYPRRHPPTSAAPPSPSRSTTG